MNLVFKLLFTGTLLVVLSACSPALLEGLSETQVAEAATHTHNAPPAVERISLRPYQAEVLETPDPVIRRTLQTLDWSDPKTWPDNRVPKPGDNVEIPAGKAVLLDVDPPALGGLTINGTLVFADQDLNLTADWIMVHGRLEVGVPSRPYTHKAVITLTGNTTDVMGMGNKFISVMGGTLSLVGQKRVVWTKLNQTLEKGETTLTLLETPDWQAGDKIVVASTDFDYQQAETFTIKRIIGKTITLDKAARFMHYGELQSYNNVTVDQRAEVGLLSRNIVIQGDDSSAQTGFGGHVMVMAGQAVFDSVEFFRMGQRGSVGRYPIHWHLLGDNARGQYLRNSSVHESFNRCVTIHASNGIKVQNNVAFNTTGHCIFLEDGAEVDTLIENNLVLSTYAAEKSSAILPTDHEFPGPSSFWITHPKNIVRNNVAAGSEGSGFWYAFPAQPTGLSSTTLLYNRYSPLADFSNNVAHSNSGDGLHVDNGPKANVAAGTEPTQYAPYQDPDDIESYYGREYNASSTAPAVFTNFVAYKNRHNGAWLRGQNLMLQNPIFSDNAIGATMAANNSVLRGGTFIGETANLGTSQPGEKTGPQGRTLPKPWNCGPGQCFDFPIRGFEFYDGTVGVEDSYFANYENNDVRQASALSYLQFTSFPTSPNNYASNLSFAPETRRVHLATRSTPDNPSENTEDGYRSSVFRDKDGSVTGKANQTVVVNNPFLTSDACEQNTDWNAFICADSYVGFYIETDMPAIGSVTLSLGNNRHTLYGVGSTPSPQFYGVVRSRQSYTLSLETTPRDFRLGLTHAPDAWINVALKTPRPSSVIQAGQTLVEASSLVALSETNVSGYYYDGETLHLKLWSVKLANPEDEAVRIRL
jgi:cell migration-inducing and hyaluronan-binding protein